MTYRNTEKKIIIAIPKGRILKDLTPILNKVNIIPEKEFSDMLQSYGMFGESQKWIDYIKESGKSIDSFQLRLLGKRLSDMIETMKAKDNN